MFNKPFKPPAFVRKPPNNEQPAPAPAATEPPAKRRRLSPATNNASIPPTSDMNKSSRLTSKPQPPQRKPLITVVNHEATVKAANPVDSARDEVFYNVLWRKPTAKKHKTWDGDGILIVGNGFAQLQETGGKALGKVAWTSPLLPGSTLNISGKEVEIDSFISRAEYFSGKQFLGGQSKPVNTPAPISTPLAKGSKAPPKSQLAKSQKLEANQVEQVNKMVPKTTTTTAKFKTPMLEQTIMTSQTCSDVPQPRHDPDQPGALVMPRPKAVGKGKQIVDVVVDPLLVKHLREHQRQGVTFMYECVMGLRSFGGEGAILADEMGLGKTLQTIALLWTLLKQNPVYQAPPVIKKALIVCPVTLINNWRKEFRKWLGNERIGVFVADDKKSRLTDFTMGKAYSIMIIGYEKMRTVQEELKKGVGIDIIIADEGHRLKTAQNKSALAIKSLNTERRVILSGTPIQNDLSEFFTMVDFVNPGVLGKYNTFKKEFEGPIVRSRQSDATVKDIEKGQTRSQELADLTSQFILRRTAEILSKYLPTKTEYVLFCRPTTAQASIYRSILSSPVFGAALGNSEMALQLINILKKVCNSPSLLKPKSVDETPSELLSSIISDIPSSQLSSPASSSKLRVLDSFLHHLRSNTAEKVVLVSNYTSTLDILGRLLTSLGYPFLRLDGSTPGTKRQQLVDRFNNTPANACFAFLLSAISGGAGLNLIVASRLVLFDVDWNPATDLQAMARIYRDGQKRPCHIYRLLVQGALDEKIYQRQMMKRGLADEVVDGKANSGAFSREELRSLFRLDEDSCRTHESLACTCGGKGNLPAGPCVATPSPPVTELEEGLDADESSSGLDIDTNGDTGSIDSPDGEGTGSLGGAINDGANRRRRVRGKGQNNATTAIVSDLDSDDSDQLPDLPTLRKASQVNMEAQEERLQKLKDAARRKALARRPKHGKKIGHDTSEAATEEESETTTGAGGGATKMTALMQYAHVDTAWLVSGGGNKDGTAGDSSSSSNNIVPDSVDAEQREQVEQLLEDDILKAVLHEQENRISFMFFRTTG